MDRGREQIRKYLSERFGMRYISIADLEDLVSGQEVQELADVLKELRPGKRRELTENDAKMVLAVYGKREELREQHRTNPYGYRTWWLTQETTVRKATLDLVKRKRAHAPGILVEFYRTISYHTRGP